LWTLLPSAARAQVIFSDNFETSPTSWGMFEEIVGGNPCYTADAGWVAQTTEQAHTGSGSVSLQNTRPIGLA
jgi:hypothetical protein